MAIIRIIDHAIYPRQALSEARVAYKDYCIVRVEPASGNKARLSIEVSSSHLNNKREVVLNFMNFMLDKALEIQLTSL